MLDDESPESTQVSSSSESKYATEDLQLFPIEPHPSLEDDEKVPKIEVTPATVHESNGNERSEVLTAVTVEGKQDLPPPPYD